jgi:hypothetical protein
MEHLLEKKKHKLQMEQKAAQKAARLASQKSLNLLGTIPDGSATTPGPQANSQPRPGIGESNTSETDILEAEIAAQVHYHYLDSVFVSFFFFFFDIYFLFFDC